MTWTALKNTQKIIYFFEMFFIFFKVVEEVYDFEEEEEDEDEFGDFGEAEEVAPVPVIHVTGLADRLSELKDWSELEEMLGVEKSRLGESDLKTQVGLGPDLSSQVEDDETVWRRLEDPGSVILMNKG